MDTPRILPFGSWPSALTPERLAGATIRLGQVAIDGDAVLWTEGRPQERGRNVLVRCAGGTAPVDLVPAPFDVRTRVHEYGGGAFVALGDGGVAFSHDADQQLYRLDATAGAVPARLTDAPSRRFADAALDLRRRRLIAVCEDHGTGAREAVASLVAIPLDGTAGTALRLVDGHDFFSTPRVSPDGRRLAWLAWDHPNMPWDGTELWLADLDADGLPRSPRRVAGGPDESIFQPAWSPAGALHFVSDRSGWWNLYRLGDDGALPLHPMAADFGEPQWAFGMATYGFAGDGRIVCVHRQDGRPQLARLDPANGAFEPIETPFLGIGELKVAGDTAVFVGATARDAAAIVRLDLRSNDWTVLRSSAATALDPASVSVAEPIRFASDDGVDAHAFFYPPTNPAAVGPPGDKPPLIVVSHGGPTGAADAGFKASHQFWTSRGFAVVDVNYGGSTGFGRAYRDRLRGRWGIVDVDDSIAAARFLVDRGDVDGERVIVRGASAGGYTTLAALTFRRFFKAGASHYGIGDLEALVRDTHKFESRYLDRLVGPYPAAQATYRERSPIHHVDGLASPMILFQGAEDKAVPPAQAQAMFDAVAAKGLPVALLIFAGEQHGFRREETIRKVFAAELAFYARVFGFVPADGLEPIDIRNL